MIEYKSIRFVDGKVRWIIVDKDGQIVNNNPSKEDLKRLEEESYVRNIIPKTIYYNRTNTCDRCGISFDNIGWDNPRREYDIERNWTGKWDCRKCYEKYDSNSHSNIRKSMRPCRTGNRDQNSENAKGDLFQELTCIWRSTISTIPVEDLNKKLDNYRTPIDHSPDSELGIIQTKGKFYDSYNQSWSITLKNEHNAIRRGFDFNVLIFYCANKYGNIIDRLYIFPKEEVSKRIHINIAKDIIIGPHWYEKYRITDEETIKKINEIWKDIIDKK